MKPSHAIPPIFRLAAAVLALAVPASGAVIGPSGNSSPMASSGSGAPSVTGSAAAAIVQQRAAAVLNRTQGAILAAQQFQAAAHAVAVAGSNHLVGTQDVPNGMSLAGAGGLVPDSGLAATGVANPVTTWINANTPTQTTANGQTTVNVVQTGQDALLYWSLFNIGKNTTLAFDQTTYSAGNAANWIAFNQVAAGVAPSQILGNIAAAGQVYVLNQNGIIFGGSSQVNVGTLVAASLPINTNLAGPNGLGILNNPQGQFLFSQLNIAGLSGGTPGFTPPPAPAGMVARVDKNGDVSLVPAAGQDGDVAVQAGAKLATPPGASGTVAVASSSASSATVTLASASVPASFGVGSMLLGAVVTGIDGTTVTLGSDANATISAATATSYSSSSGRVALIGPSVGNQGTISTPDGQTILAAGLQVGFAAHPSTDPSLRGLDVAVGVPGTGAAVNGVNGFIDAPRADVTMTGPDVGQLGVVASTTSVSLNGRIDLLALTGYSFGGGVTLFSAPTTEGTVTLGPNSITAIVPEYDDTDRQIGTSLTLPSQVNVQGENFHMAADALLFAPNASVLLNLGALGQPASSTGTALLENGNSAQASFLPAPGQVYLDAGSEIDVAGSADVAASVQENVVSALLTAAALENSPLQRDGILHDQTVQVDVSQTVTYDGQSYVGSALADFQGYAGLVERNVGELTAAGGTVVIHTNGSVVMQPTSVIDVSGGYINYQGGMVQTTVLMAGGQLVPIAQASPDMVYQGIYGAYSTADAKWNVTQTYGTPLDQGTYQAGYLQGGSGGTLVIDANAVALDGSLYGNTVAGARQQTAPSMPGTLALSFGTLAAPGVTVLPVNITFQQALSGQAPVAPFPSVDPAPNTAGVSLSVDRQGNVYLSPDLVGMDGFGNLTVNAQPNPTDPVPSKITVAPDAVLSAAAGGTITLVAGNFDLYGKISIPDGTLNIESPGGFVPDNNGNPIPYDPALGSVHLYAGAVLSTAGLTFDEMSGAVAPGAFPLAVNGGSVTIVGAATTLDAGSLIDVSGGAARTAAGKTSTGTGGSISVTGYSYADQGGAAVAGSLVLNGTLEGYGVGKGGSLTLDAPAVQVGGPTPFFSAGTNALWLKPGFFSQGGFSSFSMVGVAATEVEGAVAPVLTEEVVNPSVGAFGLVRTSSADLPAYPPAPVNLTFSAPGSVEKGGFLGTVTLAEGAVITAPPTSTVSLTGQMVDVLGSIRAAGGTITVAGKSTSSLIIENEVETYYAPLVSVYLGPQADLDVSGETITTPTATNNQVYATGSVLAGGTITISGNIVGEAGARLDADGAQGTINVPSTSVANPSSAAAVLLGIAPYVSQTVGSNGGAITLSGTEMLYYDGEVSARAGNATALGGTLTVGSGVAAFSTASMPNTGYVELQIQQSGAFLTGQTVTLGATLPGATAQGGGHFTADQFAAGGFDSLNLDGNVQFLGNVSLNAPGDLTITPDAMNGTIFGDGSAHQTINLSAYYVAIGGPIKVAGITLSPFAPPYQTVDSNGNVIPPAQAGLATPTYGPATLNVTATDLIDVGYLSLQNVGTTNFTSGNDIRGGGLLYGAGTLNFDAGQIYTPTDATFTIAAFAGGGQAGTVDIGWNGVARGLPYSAGGTINVYGATIDQNGVLRAPFGTINLGALPDPGTGLTPVLPGIAFSLVNYQWVGTPVDNQYAPVTQSIVLGPQSQTSVSGVDPVTGQALVLPFGTDLNGVQWLNPATVDITAGGLPAKSVVIQGRSVNDSAGSVVGLAGGGDLFAYQFNPGLGGTHDILASSTGSFAIVPGYQADYAPADLTAGSTGAHPYADTGLQVGQQVYLAGGDGLAAGVYTLLPARYALVPGAYLVTPTKGAAPAQAILNPDGSVEMAGHAATTLNPGAVPVVMSFEVDSAAVVNSRAEYDLLSADTFLKSSAVANNQPVPRLPIDAGGLVFNATNSLQINGTLSGQAGAGGLGSDVDIASPEAIEINGTGTDAGFAGLVLDAANLSDFGANSLLVGGYRTSTSAGTTVTVTTGDLVVNNAGTALSANDVILVSNATLTVDAGSEIDAVGTGAAQALAIVNGGAGAANGSSDGTLLRVSSDPGATISRPNEVNLAAAAPAISIGAATIRGGAMTVDSTAAATLDPGAVLDVGAVSLGSGRISVVLDSGETLQANPGLVLSGAALQTLQGNAQSLALRSYSSIDFYGSGTIGGAAGADGIFPVGSLTLDSAEVRGFSGAGGGGSVAVNAQSVTLDNAANGTAPGPVPGIAPAGSFTFNAGTINLGANTLEFDGYADLNLSAANGILASGSGGLASQGAMTLAAPVVTGAAGANYAFSANGGSLAVVAPAGPGAVKVAGGLGASLSFTGQSVTIDSTISASSGTITAVATTGDVEVQAGGTLDVRGEAVSFDNVIGYTSGGQVNLTSDNGGVALDAGSRVDVSAQPGGGNAGSVVVTAPNGTFTAADGTLQGAAGAGGTGGNFSATVGQAATLSSLTTPLADSGFSSLQFDVLTGSVTVDGLVGPALASGQPGLTLFSLTAEQGGIAVDSTINASGTYGGTIELYANQGVTLTGNAVLSVAGKQLDSAGEGGLIDIETRGAGAAGSNAIDIEANATLDLSIAGGPGGVLHLRAPQTTDQQNLLIDKIYGNIVNPSSIVAEGYEVYTSTTGIVDNTAQNGNIEGAVAANVAAFGGNVGAVGMSGSITDDLVGGTVNARYAATGGSSVNAVLHVQPGEEIVNPTSSIPFQLNGRGSSVAVNAGSPVGLPSGTPGNDVITSTSAGTLTVNGVATTFQANVPITIPAGGTITLANNGTLTFSGGSGGGIPLSLSSGTFTPGSTGVDTITGGASVVTLTAKTTSSVGFAAGSTIGLPSGTASLNSILSTSAGTITTTSATGMVTTTALAANKATSIPAGSTITFSGAGSFTLGTLFGGAFAVQPVTLSSPTNFTLSGPTSLVASAGNLTLNNTWNLAALRTASGEPGILTFRAAGNLVFNGSLTDGFAFKGSDPENVATSPYTWDVISGPSWSYRLVSGAAFVNDGSGNAVSPANYAEVQSAALLGSTSGSLLLGQNIPAGFVTGTTTATTASIYAQMIRTGTGSITIDAGGSVDLLNQLATIYTAGDAAPDIADFNPPTTGANQSNYGGYVAPSAPQYAAQYTQNGGNIIINAQGNISHLTQNASGALVTDTSWQFPTNWLYRRGAISSPETFGQTINGKEAASTTWWIDFSNFFDSVGALGGGNVTLHAGGNITNVDASIPTNARMPYNSDAATSLVQLGGGDLTVIAGGAISGGNFYVANGTGLLQAGSITTNSLRISKYNPTLPLPVTLFLGDGSFTVNTTGDLLIGPTVNPFWLPQGIGNTLDDQSIFETYGASTSVNLSSLLGSINVENQGLLNAFAASAAGANDNKTPWTLFMDGPPTGGGGTVTSDYVSDFSTFMDVAPPIFNATAFSGNIQYTGNQILLPSAKGTLQLLAAGSIDGASGSGVSAATATITVLDDDPSLLPTVTNPFGLFLTPTTSGRPSSAIFSLISQVTSDFGEAPSYTYPNDNFATLESEHTLGLLHDNDTAIHIDTVNGSIGDFTLISPEQVQISSGLDIQDVAFYIQNNNAADISTVTAARDITLYDPNSTALVGLGAANSIFAATGDVQISGPGTLEVLAGRNLNLGVGNVNTSTDGSGTGLGITSIGNSRNPYLPFDGANIIAASGIGLSASQDNGSLGLSPAAMNAFVTEFLQPGSSLSDRYLPDLGTAMGMSAADGPAVWTAFEALPAAQQDAYALNIFYLALRDAGRDHNDPTSPNYGSYANGYAALAALFPDIGPADAGDISLTSREIKTTNDSDISLFAPGGQMLVGYDLVGSQPIDQGIFTVDGGDVNIFTRGDVTVGTSRIFTLHGGNLIIWSTLGNIDAGASSKTVTSAPPQRVLIDPQSGSTELDLAGISTGGGIGVLASVVGAAPGDVDLIAPNGIVDAGDAGIRVSGNINISAVEVLNASNITVGGKSTGIPTVTAPNIAGLTAASSANGAADQAAAQQAAAQRRNSFQPAPMPSLITVEVLGYGGGDDVN